MNINFKSSEEKWKLGDVLSSRNSSHDVGLIVKNDDGDYCLMDISQHNPDTYSTETMDTWEDTYDSLVELQHALCDDWRRVNATLNIKM